jgi:hypothetical protein
MSIETAINLDYLLPTLRFKMGDIDPASYRYTDGWLRVALISGVNAMQRWWGDRYIVDSAYNTTRGASYTFLYTDPPLIQGMDERPLILMSSILIKSGQLESNSWNVGSWKDAEIAVSNIEGSRSKQFGLGLDWEELKMYILPPTHRLSGALRIPHPEVEE